MYVSGVYVMFTRILVVFRYVSKSRDIWISSSIFKNREVPELLNSHLSFCINDYYRVSVADRLQRVNMK